VTARVGINLLWLAPGEVGGSEDYTIGLLRALAAHDRSDADVDIVLYLNRAVAATYRDLADSFTARIGPVSGRGRVARVVAEHTWLRRAVREDRCRLVHHLGGTAPLLRSAPSVVMVHDLQAWEKPQNFALVKRAYLRAVVPATVGAARAVTTLSRWVQHDMQSRLRIPAHRIVCLPPGAERLVGSRDVSMDESVVLERYDIGDRPFFIYPAITYPHKNHTMLVRAFAQVVERHPDALLVLTGGEGSAEGDVRAAIERAGVSAHVRRVGRVPSGALAVLYRRTTALTFASRYEGFGMPVLEAMNEGRPVVAARAAALPEVVGDGGLLVDPNDVTGWASALDLLLRDKVRWHQLAEAARHRAASFTWERTVDDLLALYRRTVRP
jgi:alpha-1,3-rhamnosyl/mannosyltransferase